MYAVVDNLPRSSKKKFEERISTAKYKTKKQG